MTTPPTEYEYRQCPTNHRLIQVRPLRAQGQAQASWERYMLTDSESQAERVLALLQQGDVARVVLP